MIDGKFDMVELNHSLRKYSKQFGEASAQAVMRWGVQTGRDLAFESQAYGTKKTRETQESAITFDAYKVFLVVDEIKLSAGSARIYNNGKSYSVKRSLVCQSASTFDFWIEQNRTRRRSRRTAKLPVEKRMVITRANFKKWIRPRLQRAGMAKGGWIGSGQGLVASQTGADKMKIGKNFLSYAQKHTSFGSASTPQQGFNPATTMNNKAVHSASPYVLTTSRLKKAQQYALSKTVKFYKKALDAINRKKSK